MEGSDVDEGLGPIRYDRMAAIAFFGFLLAVAFNHCHVNITHKRVNERLDALEERVGVDEGDER